MSSSAAAATKKKKKKKSEDTNPNWTKVEEAETLRIEFYEAPGESVFQYSADIVWKEPGQGRQKTIETG